MKKCIFSATLEMPFHESIHKQWVHQPQCGCHAIMTVFSVLSLVDNRTTDCPFSFTDTLTHLHNSISDSLISPSTLLFQIRPAASTPSPRHALRLFSFCYPISLSTLFLHSIKRNSSALTVNIAVIMLHPSSKIIFDLDIQI